MPPKKELITQEICRLAPLVARDLVLVGKDDVRELESDASAKILKRIHFDPGLARDLETRYRLTGYVRQTLKSVAVSMLRKRLQNPEQAAGFLFELITSDKGSLEPTARELEEAALVIERVRARLLAFRRGRQAVEVLDGLIHGKALVPLARKGSRIGKHLASIRKAAEAALARQFGEEALAELAQAIRTLSALVRHPVTTAPAKKDLGLEVVQLAETFRLARGDREYARRLNALDPEIYDAFRLFFEGVPWQEVAHRMAAEYALPREWTHDGRLLESAIRPFQVRLLKHVAKLQATFDLGDGRPRC